MQIMYQKKEIKMQIAEYQKHKYVALFQCTYTKELNESDAQKHTRVILILCTVMSKNIDFTFTEAVFELEWYMTLTVIF